MSVVPTHGHTPGYQAMSVKIDDGPDLRRHHFHARYKASPWRRGTIHRICLEGSDLLFIDTGLPTLDAAQRAQQVAGALGYGFIPGMMGQIAAEKNTCSAARWTRALDAATPKQLRTFADTDPRCFRVAARDAYEVLIRPLGVWDLLTRGTHCKAIVRIFTAERGPITLELLTIDDVGVILAEFPRLFGTTFQNDVKWNSI